MACKGVAVAVLERTSAADEGPDSAGGSSQAARRRAKRELAAAVASAAAAAEPLGGWTPQAAGTVADVYATIGAKDRAKYEAHFSRADKTSEGLVAREEAGLLFSRAKVPAAAIDSIYDHCVPEGSDGLDSVAFAAAMHLVYAALRAKLAHLLDSKPPIRTGTDDDTNIDEEEEDKDDDGEEVAQQAVFPAKNADAPTAERDAPTRFAASDSAVSEGTESYASSGSNGEIVPASAVGAAGDAVESAGFSTLESAAFEQARVAEAEAEASAGPESSFANAPAEGFAAFDSAVFEPAAAGHSPLSKGFATFGSNALDPTPSASDGAPEAAHAQGPAESQQQEQEPQPQQQAPTSAADIGAPPAFEADFSDSAAFSASGASGEPSIVSSSSSEGSAVAAKQPPRKRQLFSNAAFEADISSPQGDDEEGGGDLDESFGESPEFHTPSTEEPAEDAGEFGGAQSDSSDGMEARLTLRFTIRSRVDSSITSTIRARAMRPYIARKEHASGAHGALGCERRRLRAPSANAAMCSLETRGRTAMAFALHAPLRSTRPWQRFHHHISPLPAAPQTRLSIHLSILLINASDSREVGLAGTVVAGGGAVRTGWRVLSRVARPRARESGASTRMASEELIFCVRVLQYWLVDARVAVRMVECVAPAAVVEACLGVARLE